MDFHEYQKLSARTANNHTYRLANYGMGIAGEAGEVSDLLKKHVFHGHSVEREDVKKELGDVLWYVSQIATEFNISLEIVAEANIEKLKKRYPKGFREEDSIHREE